jgi:hypothetical protein
MRVVLWFMYLKCFIPVTSKHHHNEPEDTTISRDDPDQVVDVLRVVTRFIIEY